MSSLKAAVLLLSIHLTGSVTLNCSASNFTGCPRKATCQCQTDLNIFLSLSVTSNDGSTLIDRLTADTSGMCNRDKIMSSDIGGVICRVNENNSEEIRFVVNVTSTLTVDCNGLTHILHPLRK